ncbi:uncharacterized protein Dwil_GK12778 [Drosophila willistoni]|uniref:Uncharacterized protein n=1 Tax=Drosophila willistoni TaxID=7260 RepID=B4NK86_DROWI|nr:insulin-like growth factor-binding protein complex acid labile subunit [Drosophila willistoni]EDW85128.1 uncharacterized protein Dwil_GK12778 [Drosophila willistoni]
MLIKQKKHFVYTVAIILLLALVQAEDQQQDDDEDYVQQDVDLTKRLIKVDTMADKCILVETEQNVKRCRGFTFDKENEVAFFDLQTPVRISPDRDTYEVGNQPRLDVLIFQNSTFNTFPLHLFYSLELSELDMRNCQMKHVTWESFLMANNLRILLLSENNIEEIDESTFNYASELQFLFLRGNRLSRLNRKSFKGLRKLQHLDLSGNRLTELAVGIFDDLERLQQIDLSDNQLSFLGNELFGQNSHLLTVNLNTNHLRAIEENAFRRSTNSPPLLAVDLSHNNQLNVLLLNLNAGDLRARNCSLDRVNLYGSVTNVDLSDNRLRELYFTQPEILERLILRNNSLGQLSSLTRVPRLRYLDVGDNPGLGDLPENWQTPALQYLDISNTGQQQLDIDALKGMPQLRKLNISSNNISQIDPPSFMELSHLTHFYLHANNWNCYNLNNLMNILIRPFGITYTPDRYDTDYPGEYVFGIACMYRLTEPETESESSSASASASSSSVEYVSLESQSQNLQHERDQMEIDKLRQELKSVVQHFDAKFDNVFQQLLQLNLKMKSIENINNTLWKDMTVSISN